jgi:hypothetical protein
MYLMHWTYADLRAIPESWYDPLVKFVADELMAKKPAR